MQDAPRYKCSLCQDNEWIVDPKHNWQAIPCSCAEKNRLQRRLKNALIPEEFTEAKFENYQVISQIQKRLKETAIHYLRNFPQIQGSTQNSLGFIAEVGETQIKRLPDLTQRAEMTEKYNSFGLGKTHLQMAMAKHLLHKGHAVLCISDVTFMHDLAQAKRISDGGTEFYRLLGAVTEAPILIWDDLGKSKHTETKEELYYWIINDRYKARKPIIFSSNEDDLTLSEKLGDAAYSRLYSMAKDYFVRGKGVDYRVSHRL